jgi:hypothetical protein
MTDYKALIKSLTKKQREVLDQICCDNDSCHPLSTLNSLIKKGLIERYTVKWIYHYRVSFAAHIAWCELCAEENPDELEAIA